MRHRYEPSSILRAKPPNDGHPRDVANKRKNGKETPQGITKRPELHKIPLVWMWIAQIVFLVSTMVSAQVNQKLLWIPLVHLVYGIGVIYLGYYHQAFRKEPIISSAPMVWLPLFTVAYTTGIALSNWDGTTALIESHPQKRWLLFQAMRVLAFKSIQKYYEGVFPFAFAWFTAFPDGLFGLSAVTMIVLGVELPMKALALWNLVGFAVIVPFGLIAHQSGMSPTKLYEPKVSHEVIFYWPMAMAPLLVVPMLLSWNQIIAIWALSRQ